MPHDLEGGFYEALRYSTPDSVFGFATKRPCGTGVDPDGIAETDAAHFMRCPAAKFEGTIGPRAANDDAEAGNERGRQLRRPYSFLKVSAVNRNR